MNSPFKFARLASICLGLLALGVACDLGKVTSQATSNSVAVATVVSTPPIEIRGEAIAGIDGSVPTLPDGGALPIDAGVTLPSQNLVTVFFGTKGASLDTPPVGVTGATVSLDQVGGASYPLVELGAGNYAITDGGFSYTSHATYDVTIVSNGTTYVAEVERVPVQERVPAFHPPAGYVDQIAGQPFTFTRPEPASGEELQLGFVTVFPVDTAGGQGQPTYTNLPQSPLQFLKLAVAPTDWKKQQMEIPGTAFPTANQNYVIILQSAKLGGPKSDNLFTATAVIAGTADIAIVKSR